MLRYVVHEHVELGQQRLCVGVDLPRRRVRTTQQRQCITTRTGEPSALKSMQLLNTSSTSCTNLLTDEYFFASSLCAIVPRSIGFLITVVYNGRLSATGSTTHTRA
jgi:hypothetical protein